MKKQRIVLASVLKPVDDTRMFEKMGKSLCKNPDFEVFIVGYPSNKPSDDPNIEFLPHPNFARISLVRAFIPLVTLKTIFKVKPDLVIVNTHELLIVAVISRILFGSKIMYDVQENYWRNILWTDAFPPLIKHLLAVWVRCKEFLLSPFFHLFILAEKGFEKEMRFFKKKYIVVENKSLLPQGFVRSKPDKNINLLFSGTIGKSTGVFQAINLAKCLYQSDSSVRLHIIGHCVQASTLQELKHTIAGHSFITLTGGHELVPHPDIIAQIFHSDFGIIYYPSSPHTENKIPTKLYEYLSAQLPIIIQNHPPWTALCQPYQAAIPIDFNSPVQANDLLVKMKQTLFYPKSPANVFWSTEEKVLLESVTKILI